MNPILYIWIFLQLYSNGESASIVHVDNSKNESPNNDQPVLNEEIAPACGQHLVADYLARPIEQPLGRVETVHCEWWIRAPLPFLTVGLSVTNVQFNYYYPYVITIYVYDGTPSNASLLSFFRGPQDIGRFLTHTVSTTNTLFINYTRTGPVGKFEASLLYYICGGLVQNNLVLRSPVFNVSTPDDSPNFLHCVWRIERPKSARYGYFIVDHLDIPEISCCEGLVVTTYNGSLAAIEDKNGTSTTETNSTNLGYGEFDEVRRDFCKGPSSTESATKQRVNISSFSNTTTNNKTIALQTRVKSLNIRSKRVIAVLFNGSTTILNYTTVFPHQGNGFRLIFENSRKKYKNRRRQHREPWYLDYAQVVFYLPIGLLLGGIIIIVQGRNNRKLPIRTFVSRGTYSAASSLAEDSLQQNTPRSPVRSIMKRPGSPYPNPICDSPHEAKSKVQLSSSTTAVVGAENAPMIPGAKQNVRNGKKRRTNPNRKVTFKKPSIETI